MEKTRRKIIVGVPVRNDLKSFKFMINSLIGSTNFYDKILIIESESTDGCKEYCDKLVELSPKIQVVHTAKEGPLAAYNRLFDIAIQEEADLLLTQTDVVFPTLYETDWLQTMYDVASREDVGAVTTLNGCGRSGPDYINNFDWLGGWCTYLPYKTLKVIGKYDDTFYKGWGVDIDYSYRIFKAGLKCVVINYWVHHHMMNERTHDYSNDVETEKKIAAEHFRKKWKLGEFKDVVD